MLYINIPIDALTSSEYRRSKPVKRATWLNLLGHCCQQENSGRIVGAALWEDREWQQVAAVTLEEVRMESSLWSWQGDDLIVWAYPIEQETVLKKKREGGAKGAAKRWPQPDATTPIPPSEPEPLPPAVPVGVPPAVPVGKETERNETERNDVKERAPVDGDAIRRMVRRYGAACGKAPSGEAEKAALRLIQSGEVTLEELIAKVDEICAACHAVPLTSKGFLPRPYDLFAENGWLVSPDVYRATGVREVRTSGPSGVAPKRQDWQIRNDIDALKVAISKIRNTDTNWRHFLHKPDPDSEFTEPRKELRKAAAEEIKALTKKVDALNEEMKHTLPN
jgi:hypothetical protein